MSRVSPLVLAAFALVAGCYARHDTGTTDAAGHDGSTTDASVVPIDATMIGACAEGASCEGDGECDEGGRCIHILAEVTSPQGITVDAVGVYFTGGGFTADGYVKRCGLEGCDRMPTTLATGQIAPQPILVDQGELFWATSNLDGLGSGAVMACTAASCMPRAVFAGPYAYTIALDANAVYMTSQDQIRSCARAGCGSSATVLATPMGHHWGAVVVGSTLFWTTSASPGSTGGLMRCAIDACVPSVVALGVMQSGGIATDETFVYYTDTLAGTVWRASVDGTMPPTVLASGLSMPVAIATDGSEVYFTTTPMGPGAVYACPVAGCGAAPRIVARGQRVFSPGAIALDARSVYWTDFNTNLVVRANR